MASNIHPNDAAKRLRRCNGVICLHQDVGLVLVSVNDSLRFGAHIRSFYGAFLNLRISSPCRM
jgi:hypothetical protein